MRAVGSGRAPPVGSVGANAGTGGGYAKQTRLKDLPPFDSQRSQYCRDNGLCFICEQKHRQSDCPHKK
jgi:hypothetical protein